MIIAERLEKVCEIILGSGSHDSPEDGMCVMEAVAFVAGEQHGDAPACACPVISAFMRRWNDDLDEAGRQWLKPYIAKLVGTKSTREAENRRAWLAADWLVRRHMPAWLQLGGMKEQADALRALPQIASRAILEQAQPAIESARTKADAARAAARAAAGAAARAAARDAARAAARAAAGAAAWDAARADAGAAAWDAAWDGAWDGAWAAAAWAAAAWDAAAWDAAWDAAWKKLEPTKVSLQASAFELLDHMIEVR